MHTHIPPKNDSKDVWIPTPHVGEKLWQFLDESFVNRPHNALGERPLFEVLAEPGGEQAAREFLVQFPPRPGKTAEDVLTDARAEAGPYKYNQAYEMSGGLLNILLPHPNEQVDEVWQNLLKKYYEEEEFDSEAEKQNRLKELGVLWNYTPNDIFSMLTPAQVWAGGGLRESDLMTRFFEEITYRFSKKIKTPGEAILRSLLYLRSWQTVPLAEYGFKTAFQIIQAEREEIRLKKEALAGYHRPVLTFPILKKLDPVANLLLDVLPALYEAEFIEKSLRLWKQVQKHFEGEKPEIAAGTVAFSTSRQLGWESPAEHFATLFAVEPEAIEKAQIKIGTPNKKNS